MSLKPRLPDGHFAMPRKARLAQLFSMALVLTSACGASSVSENVSRPSGTASAPTASSDGTSQKGPIVSALLGPQEAPSSGESLVLQGIVTQRVPSKATVRVKLALPSGVQLIEGSSDQRLPPTIAPRTDALRFVIRPKEIPDEDAVLIVDLRGDGFGYHAEHRYRFGRAQPTPAAPVRSGVSPRVHGSDLGPSVRVPR